MVVHEIRGIHVPVLSVRGCDLILSWADMFEQANTETKHMILAKLIERVDVSADGQIQIKFRLTAKEYLGEQPDDVTCNPEKVS